MYRKLTTVALTVAILVGGLAFSNSRVEAQRGGQGSPAVTFLAGLVNVFLNDTIDIDDTNVQVGLVNVNNALNDVDVLNNLLRNANIDITLTDVDVIDIETIELLREAQVDVDALIGVAVLSSQDLIAVTRQSR